MYLVRVYKNREQIARKVMNLSNANDADLVARSYCQLKGGGAYTVTPVTR